MFNFSRPLYLRYNPNPISWTTWMYIKLAHIPCFLNMDIKGYYIFPTSANFALVLIMFHKTFTCSVMIHNCNIVCLIWVQNCNIHFYKCLILPKGARISNIKTHSNCNWLYKTMSSYWFNVCNLIRFTSNRFLLLASHKFLHAISDDDFYYSQKKSNENQLSTYQYSCTILKKRTLEKLTHRNRNSYLTRLSGE